MVTLNLTGATPVASNLRQVASGIRNSFGLAFDPATGDLLFGDNAIDGSPTPPQADELNRISAANLGTIVPNFGFPTCYPDYTTGLLVGSGCVAPLAAFIPTVQGRRQGAANIALAPSSFPAGYNNGVFVGFAGQFFGAGVIYNPVTYYDFGTGKYTDVILEGTLGRPIGLLSTADSLFISDFSTGSVFQITSAAPEPGSGVPIGLALCALALRQRTRSRCRTAGPTPATP